MLHAIYFKCWYYIQKNNVVIAQFGIWLFIVFNFSDYSFNKKLKKIIHQSCIMKCFSHLIVFIVAYFLPANI